MSRPAEDVWACRNCGLTPADRGERQRHQAGIDANHLACPHQDIEAINAQQSRRVAYNGMPWG